MRFILIAIAIVMALNSSLTAETVDVKYRGPVDLTPFACTDTPRSSFVRRVCYDDKSQYMVIQLNNTYYHYCEMPKATNSSSRSCSRRTSQSELSPLASSVNLHASAHR